MNCGRKLETDERVTFERWGSGSAFPPRAIMATRRPAGSSNAVSTHENPVGRWGTSGLNSSTGRKSPHMPTARLIGAIPSSSTPYPMRVHVRPRAKSSSSSTAPRARRRPIVREKSAAGRIGKIEPQLIGASLEVMAGCPKWRLLGEQNPESVVIWKSCATFRSRKTGVFGPWEVGRGVFAGKRPGRELAHSGMG